MSLTTPTNQPPAHTPGPWTFDGSVVKDSTGANVTGLVPARMTPGVLALTVSAPDLLQALQRTIERAEQLIERAAEIDRRLIAKDGRTPDCELGEIVRLRVELEAARSAIQKASVQP